MLNPNGRESMGEVLTSMGISAALGGVSFGVQSAVYQELVTGSIDWVKVLKDAATGAIMGALLAGVGGLAAARNLGKLSDVAFALAILVKPGNFWAGLTGAAVAGAAAGGLRAGMDSIYGYQAQLELMMDAMDWE
jgi:hypothetical protein